MCAGPFGHCWLLVPYSVGTGPSAGKMALGNLGLVIRDGEFLAEYFMDQVKIAAKEGESRDR